jgi:hypothetical protein
MSGKVYISSASPIPSQNISQQKPIDDRFTIDLRSDLFDANTWKIGSSNTIYTYHGMIVSVVGETDDSKNGIYMLKRRAKYNKQAWDSTDSLTYDADGWRQIYDNTMDIGGGGGTVQQVYLDILNTNEEERPGQFGGTGTQNDPYYIKLINGGVINSNSEPDTQPVPEPQQS